MGYKHFVLNLHKQKLSDEKKLERLAARKAKITANVNREITYLVLLDETKAMRKTAYRLRKLVKEGNHESCKQRKIRLNKERRAKLSK